jgi:Short repeat of unknown function (DUF308)
VFVAPGAEPSFGIDWSIRNLATFIGVLFIVQGVADALTTGIDARVRRANVVSIALGVVIIAWPEPGLVALAIVLGAYLIVGGTIAMTAAFSARRLLPSFEVKRLPDDVARTWSSLENGQAPQDARPEATRLAATPS